MKRHSNRHTGVLDVDGTSAVRGNHARERDGGGGCHDIIGFYVHLLIGGAKVYYGYNGIDC